MRANASFYISVAGLDSAFLQPKAVRDAFASHSERMVYHRRGVRPKGEYLAA